MTSIPHVFVGGVKVTTYSRAQLVELITADCLKRSGPRSLAARLLFDSNGHGISLAARDTQFQAALNSADVVHADGGFVVLASRYLAGAPVADRSATTDMIHDLFASGSPQRISHFLLGGTEEVNAACAARLKEIYPNAIIAGRRHGYFGQAEEPAVIAAINAVAPDILWIGLGKPREQLFAATNRRSLSAGWAITCGGCFNYITGSYRRAPRWMQDNNLEWLFRSVTSPKLLWRYATTSPHAIFLALTKRDRRQVGAPSERVRVD
jgi:exopolysaccharide biosynthesis WecB/TagA/CpsF family protein